MAIPAKTLLLISLSYCIAFYCIEVTTNSLDESYYEEISSSRAEAMSYLGPRINISSLSQQQQPQQRTRTSNKQNGSLRTPKSGPKNSTRSPTVRRIVHPSLHAAWDESNHLCALAKFQATFTIKYEGANGGTSQLIDKMPPNARSKGRCDQFDDEPVLDIMWKDSQPSGASKTSIGGGGGGNQNNNSSLGFTFRVIFQKFTEDDDRWGVQQMQLLYNTGHPIFRGVSQPKKVIVRSNKDEYRLQFRTTHGSSLLCPSPPPIQMYDSDGQLLVIARLSNMQLQAFQFSDSRSQGSNFDAFERCGQVSFGSGVARQNLKTNKNDGLTFMIGLMTVCIATLTVVGYAVYRSNALKTKQYKTMSD